MCGGGCSLVCSAFGYAVEIGRCKAELRRTGTRCPTCDRRCKVDFGIFGYGCDWFGQQFSRSVRFYGERLEFWIFGCVVAVAVWFVRHSAMLLRLDGARLN